MAEKPGIAIVGPGNLGAALAFSLRRAGYPIQAVIARRQSLNKVKLLAQQLGAKATADLPQGAHIVWFCVPDSEISRSAAVFAGRSQWKGRIALHSSGALTSDELKVLRKRGAAVASVHPLMTFVGGSRPSLAAVPFAIEGGARAVRVARGIVRDLGGRAYSIRKQDKAAYHAWGTFASPLFTALLAVTQEVAGLARIKQKDAAKRMIPILLQTLANYASFGAEGAFSGPIVRGDVDTVKRHLGVLRNQRLARDVYSALARAALGYLPAKNKASLQRVLESSRA